MTESLGLTSSSERSAVTEAVILMAGSGSRLRGCDESILKPLVPLLGRPLISYSIGSLVRTGFRKINAVVGFESERLSAAVKRLVPPGINMRFIQNSDWQKQNGISLLAAADYVTAPFLLTMSDHVFDDAIVDLLIESANLDCLNVAVDKKLNSIFDLEDAMKVQTRNDRVIAIGKNLRNYDAIDTGLFVCPSGTFEYLEKAKHNGDCSLADGAQLMAGDNKLRAVDIGAAWWHDVDTPQMLRNAEKQMTERVHASVK